MEMFFGRSEASRGSDNRESRFNELKASSSGLSIDHMCVTSTYRVSCGADQDCVLQNTFDVITSTWENDFHLHTIASASLSTTNPRFKTIKQGVTSLITMPKFNFEHFLFLSD